MKTTICCLSDSHGKHREIDIPECDLILHAGDISDVGEYDQLEDFNSWAGEQKAPVIFTAGNHDRTIPTDSAARKIFTKCELLIDSSTTYNNLKIYGSPWTPWFGGHYWVYNRKRGASINDAWMKIPEDVDILITHGPPKGILDTVERVTEGQGCLDLLRRVKKIKPRLHCFGHLHLQGGQQKYMFGSNTIFVNAAVCNEQYKPINPIVVVDIEGTG